MDRATALFWLILATLLGGSAFYGVQLARQQAEAGPRDAALASGDVVQLVQVIDGDTLRVRKDDGGGATVRLLGVKAFDAKAAKDDTAVHGRAAEEGLRLLADGQALRVLLNNPPRDRHGRTLANLYVGDDDLGLTLVSRGHALVYTVYPFAQLQAYRQAQAGARAARLGLWADPTAAERADALAREWSRAAP